MSFRGFKTVTTNCPSGAKICSYQRDGDSNLPVLLLLHGYPQNNLMWKTFVDEIPSEWRVLAPDLPGYGNSQKPINRDNQSLSHSKKEWARDILEAVDELYGPDTRVIAYGHDRGARVAYRMSLVFSDRVAGVALLDIVPGAYVWDAMRLEKGHSETSRSHHWIFLSSPYPLPETMIASNPEFYFKFTMAGWTGKGMDGRLSEWIQDSINPFLDPERAKDRIAAACEDYRAGATHDITDDFASSINPLLIGSLPSSPPPFSCPMLILSSAHLRRRFDVDGIWLSFGKPGMVESYQIGDESTGHFLVNEKQEEVGQRTREWLVRFSSTASS